MMCSIRWAALRDDLLNTRNLSSQGRLDAMNRRLGDVGRVEDQLLSEVGAQSSRVGAD